MSEASEIFTTPSPLTSAEEKQVNSPIPTIHKAMVEASFIFISPSLLTSPHIASHSSTKIQNPSSVAFSL